MIHMERKMILAVLYALLSLLGEIYLMCLDNYAVNTLFPHWNVYYS